VNTRLLSSFTRSLAIAFLVITSCATVLFAEEKGKPGAALPFKTHPQVFGMIQSWDSDPEYPVATEINLNAVDSNRNQFSAGEVREEDGWTVFREAGEAGFKRYRVIKAKGDYFKVEYQDNGGGTLTTASVIGFTVLKREIRKNGKPVEVRVLRVESVDTK
jgi:hypothetical protein